ncbi:MAG: PD40 domain-containing protein [Bacteroidetes bacterium]|nr:PD40 domain-containing protein [Bacteroidota bacterium]
MKTVKLLCAALLLWVSVPVIAQPSAGIPDPDAAAEHYSHGNYLMALPIYLACLKREPNNYEYNFRIGVCYIETNGHKKEAIKYLEAAEKNPKADNDTWLYLGQAYQYDLKFDDAIKQFETYKLKADKEGKTNADHYIAQCKNGKILVANPLDVNFQNLGKEVNSEYPDYYPFVTSDESMLIFTSRRKGNVGASQVEMDGYYASDIWYTKSVNGVFTKAKGAGPGVNGNYDEQCTGLSADGKLMTVYVDDISTAGDIYQSTYKNSFAKIEKLPEVVNSGFETAASYSPDGNMIFFASKRDDGQGGTDIYVCKKLPGNFGWGQALNITAINTPYNEDFPFMAPDGKTLYFSSEGHNSMGGYDLFYTIWNEEDNTWSTPRNVGYPISGPGNDYTISYTENNRVAYITSDREGGQGDMDIWRVVFNEVQQNSFTLVTGTVHLPDSTINLADLTIYLTLSSTNEDYGRYNFNQTTKKYVMALPPGKYIMTLDVAGCKPYIETINVFDIGPQGEMNKDILLVKQ